MKIVCILAAAITMPIVTVGWHPWWLGFGVFVITGTLLVWWHDFWRVYIQKD